MKRLSALILLLATVFCLAIPALADNPVKDALLEAGFTEEQIAAVLEGKHVYINECRIKKGEGYTVDAKSVEIADGPKAYKEKFFKAEMHAATLDELAAVLGKHYMCIDCWMEDGQIMIMTLERLVHDYPVEEPAPTPAPTFVPVV